MAEKKQRIIEVLQHRGGGWDLKEKDKPAILGYFDREVDAEKKAREFVSRISPLRIVVRGESGRVYRDYTITVEDRKIGKSSGRRTS